MTFSEQADIIRQTLLDNFDTSSWHKITIANDPIRVTVEDRAGEVWELYR